MTIKESREARGTGVLDKDQLRNAALIYSIGRRMGMSNRDIQIALITAMQESSLRNLNYGDRDSLGLFQQRPSMGWGTPEQVTNPRYAATKFFTELKKVKGRENMAMTEAAQAVQRSAYPDAYAKHVPLVRSIWPNLTKSGPGPAGPGPAARPAPALGPTNAWGVEAVDPGPDTSILAANWNPMLGAPDFWAEPDPEGMGITPADFLSPLTADSLSTIQDLAVEKGNFRYSKGVDGWRAAVVELAREQIGTPYKWGGTQPGGFDCSGLLQYVYGKAGINLPRISFQQANYGKRIGLKGLRPGDLVAWDNSSRNNGADHIAMYIGNGRILEAAKPGTSVRIRKLSHNEGAWGVRIDR
jgi:cell wall-associated NlpC family hydrolase